MILALFPASSVCAGLPVRAAKVRVDRPPHSTRRRNWNLKMRVRADSETFRDKATNTIREAIMSLHYRPGEPLIERHLCEETGVSRTLVREAFRLLEAEGLVRRESTRGLVVTELSPDEVRDIFDLRLILESTLLRRFMAKATEADTDEMSRLLDQALIAAEKNSGDYTSLIKRFVHLIWTGGGNAMAVKMLESLQSRINYVRVMLFRATTQDEHRMTVGLLRSVTQSVVRGETDAALDTYCRYLKRAEDRAIGIIENRKPTRPDIRIRKTDDKKG